MINVIKIMNIFIYIYIYREREREAILSILGLQNWAKIPIPL